jgi:hypothetical protein
MSTSDVTDFELASIEGLWNGQLFLRLIILVPTVQPSHVRVRNYPHVFRQASPLAVDSDSWLSTLNECVCCIGGQRELSPRRKIRFSFF